MENKRIYFKDHIVITPESIDKFKQTLQDNYIQQGKSLRVDIIATHSGRVTRNNGFYLPRYMREGASTFLENYGKPMLAHHDSNEDPIGRIVGVKYVDMVSSLPQDQLGRNALVGINDSRNIYQSQRFIDEIASSPVLSDPKFPGLGYILLTVDISDPEAIQKVLDKRYLTVSIGASTDQAVCSICKTNLVDEFCEHRPGKDYEGKKAFVIAGKLVYDEVSAVNVPADPDAMITVIHGTNIQNSIAVDALANSVPHVHASFYFADFVGGTNMEPKTEETVVADQTVVAPAQEVPATVVDTVVETPVAEQSVETPAETVVSPEDQHYEDMIAFGYELSLFDTGFEDKKLTPEARKALPKSTFCKPPEGYPVNDCNHARSAMAYAKKNNEATSVLACIRRKAKALGCPFSDGLEEEIDMILADYTKRQNPQTTQEDTVNVQTSEQDKTEETAESCESCQDSTNQQELKDVYDMLFASEKAHDEQLALAKEYLGAVCVEMERLNGKDFADKKAAVVDAASMSLSALITRLDGVKATLDVEKIMDKVNDGMSNKPEEVVQNPVLSNVQDSADATAQTAEANDGTNVYVEKYRKILDMYGILEAEKFARSIIMAGFVPADTKFE